MASAMIHIAVANEINKVLKMDQRKLLIGSIAPDMGKLIGRGKLITHFLDEDGPDDIPNMDLFVSKYKDYLNDPFVLGYYIHLYTDYFWFKYFIDEIYKNDYITKLDGTVVKCNGRMSSLYIYNDYTNLNTDLLDIYDLDCKIFYMEPPELIDVIEEIDMTKIQLLLDQMGIIVENTSKKKEFVFNMDAVQKFISTSSQFILSEIEKLGITS